MDNPNINHIRNSNITNGNIKKTNMQTNQSNMDAVIEQLIQKSETFDSFLDANSYLDGLQQNNPNIIKLDANEYKYKDYYINTGIKFINDQNVKGIKIANKLNLSCAPKLIDYIITKNGKNCILITQLEGTEKDNVLPYNECKQDVTLEAKNKFMEDIDHFMRIGYINKAIESSKNWFVVPATKRIVLGNWSEFVSLKNEENKVQYRKDITDTLGLIY